MNNPWMIAVLLGLAGSCQLNSSSFEQDLTADGHGKYWDCIYSTSVLGDINPSYARPLFDRPVTLTYNCDYFADHQRVVHYTNVDSATVADRNGSCLRFNPDEFELRDSLLFFSGSRHRILTLTPQVLVLEYEYEHRKAISVYLPSKYQIKRIQLL